MKIINNTSADILSGTMGAEVRRVIAETGELPQELDGLFVLTPTADDDTFILNWA